MLRLREALQAVWFDVSVEAVVIRARGDVPELRYHVEQVFEDVSRARSLNFAYDNELNAQTEGQHSV